MSHIVHRAVGCAVVLAVAACNGEPTPPPTVSRVDAARSTLAAAPATATADGVAAVTLTTTARDASGAPLSGLLATFTVAGTSTLSSSTATTGADGAAWVRLTSIAAGVKDVSVSIDGVQVTERATVTFIAGPAASLAFTMQPSSAVAGEIMSPAVWVTVLDAFDNVASEPSIDIALALTGGAAGAQLFGTISAVATGGSAEFADLSMRAAGTAYALTASSAGLTSASSEPFSIFAAPPAATGSSLIASPTSVPADGTQATLTVRVGDPYGNPVAGEIVTLSSSGTATVIQPASATAADGTATGSVSALTAGVQTISAYVGAVLVAQAEVTFAPVASASYAIGGVVSGLTSSGLVLATSGQPDLAVASGATAFAFATKVPSGTPYAVTAKAQPPGQTCTVLNGSGNVANGDVSDVVVDCVDIFQPLTWTWVPIEGSMCGDGSPTGIGVEVGPGASPNVLVFLDGGGACWEYTTCWVLRSASPGPFGAAELEARIAAGAGSVLDRTVPGNPYADYTFVFVPYCTGDVHSGATSKTYAPATQAWRHNGRINVSNAFQYLASALRTPAKVVVSGSSAGGFGSFHAFTKAKAAWTNARSYLVDDSGPPLANIPTATVAAWYASWDLGTVVADVCGAPCATDPPTLAPVIPALAAAYPTDRFALLSSTQDQVIREFFTDPTTLQPMDAAVFEASLRELAAAIEDDSPETPPGETHAFLVSGTTHPMLDRPGSFSSQGVALLEWLRRQVQDDPAWAAAIPPPP